MAAKPGRYGRRPGAAKRKAAAAPGPETTLSVTALGDRGDGIAAEAAGGPFYIPGALPGETVTARPGARKGDGRAADLVSIQGPSADRVPPPCPHAADCGGCDLQHLAPAALSAWKRDKVLRALAHRGLPLEGDIPVADTLSLPAGSRRRLTVGLRGRAREAVIGFRARESHRLVDAPGCLLPSPALRAALTALRQAAPGFLAPAAEAEATLLETEAGVDMILRLPGPPDLAARESLAAFADGADLARLSLSTGEDGGLIEPVAARRAPRLSFGGHGVVPPPGAFTQPGPDGEAALIRLVLDGIADLPADAPVADLYCGLGTFALPLAGGGTRPVWAVDGDSPALRALEATRLPGLRCTARDLAKAPPKPKELAGLSAVVFDPPRTGAKAVAEALAASGPARVIGVSCNPATFARDARILCDEGYRLVRVAPVDQFPWSHHVEVVGVFTR